MGRFLRINTFSIPAVILAGQVLLNPNRQRVGFSVTQTNTAGQFILQVSDTPSPACFAIQGTSRQISPFTLLTHGDLVTRQIAILAPAGLTTLDVVEWTLPESVLAYAMELFDSGYQEWLNRH